MADRLDLHSEFVDILGTRNESISRVYFQPPTSVLMKYPAIRYSLSDIDSYFANNGLYTIRPLYEVILIDSNPESEYFDKILKLPYCRFVRVYTMNNLNHFVFYIYN